MMRLAATALVLAAACGPRRGAGDPCIEAARRGPPPAELSCPEGAEPLRHLERRRLDRVPDPGGERGGAEVSERRWCEGETGPAGPYVGLDGRGRVIESGTYGPGGQTEGDWIVWSPEGRPVAISRHRAGRAEATRSCAP